jgi:AcrR family transcriptional regulator
MPKLNVAALEQNQIKIEQAALHIFTRQGYHGTSIREIAEEADVSLGNIYNYYKTKEDIFVSLVRRYEKRMRVLQAEKLTPLIGSLEPHNLQRLSEAVREIIYNEPDYWRLMYVDIVEFGNEHFAHIFRDLAKNIRTLGQLGSDGASGSRPDTTLPFTAIYLQFFTYYLVEKLFGGKQHLGMPEDQAIAELIRIYTTGISPIADGRKERSNGKSKGISSKPRLSSRRKKS